MKKLYTSIIFCLLFTSAVFAQSYVPLLDSVNIWHQSGTGITVRLHAPAPAASPCQYPGYFGYSKMYYTVNDTIIDSLVYKIVRQECDLNPNYCDFGYVREDTALRKVYFRDNLGNPEIVLYDFSMQIGDTIPVTVISGNYFNSGTYVLDSIVTIPTGLNSTRRLFCLNPYQSFGNTMYWAEGIGCLVDAFYAYGTNENGMAPPFWQCRSYAQGADGFLTCFDHAQRQYFDSCEYNQAVNDFCFLVTDTCNYGNICGSVGENKMNATVDVFPNPASECLNVSFESEERGDVFFTIYDAQGRLVNGQLAPIQYQGGQKRFAVDISALAPGSYLLQCRSGDASVSVPFIVE